MKFNTNCMSTIEELEAAWELVASCTATLACGCYLDDDEADFSEALSRICRDYCKAYDQRFSL